MIAAAEQESARESLALTEPHATSRIEFWFSWQALWLFVNKPPYLASAPRSNKTFKRSRRPSIVVKLAGEFARELGNDCDCDIST